MNGSASLNGTVQASFASGSYVTKQYNILATTGGLGGSRFSSLANTNLPAGFNDNLSYASSHFNSLSSALSASKDCTARPPGLHPRLQPASISGSGDGNSSFGRAHPTKWIPRGFAEITAR